MWKVDLRPYSSCEPRLVHLQLTMWDAGKRAPRGPWVIDMTLDPIASPRYWCNTPFSKLHHFLPITHCSSAVSTNAFSSERALVGWPGLKRMLRLESNCQGVGLFPQEAEQRPRITSLVSTIPSLVGIVLHRCARSCKIASHLLSEWRQVDIRCKGSLGSPSRTCWSLQPNYVGMDCSPRLSTA